MFFVRDRQSGTTERVSMAADGSQSKQQQRIRHSMHLGRWPLRCVSIAARQTSYLETRTDSKMCLFTTATTELPCGSVLPQVGGRRAVTAASEQSPSPPTSLFRIRQRCPRSRERRHQWCVRRVRPRPSHRDDRACQRRYWRSTGQRREWSSSTCRCPPMAAT